MATPFEILDWGLIDYTQALQQQMELVEKVAIEDKNGFVIFCSHPPIVTLGRKTEPGDVFAWQGPVVEVSRGGRATYHGPSQLVIYPIINLGKAQAHRPYHDINQYLRNLEELLIQSLKEIGITAHRKIYPDTGVWVGSKKIASLGVAVKNWVTYHGAAINVTSDPMAFQGMNPCGFSGSIMTTIEEQILATTATNLASVSTTQTRTITKTNSRQTSIEDLKKIMIEKINLL